MQAKSIAKNTAFITSALVLQKVISFVYFTLIARNIGAEGTGKYFFALSFTTVFVVFIDLGLTQVLIREGAKVKDKIQKYLSSVLFAKVFFGILTYVAAIVIINFMGYPVETKHLVYLSAVTMLFDSLHLTIYGVLRSIGNLKYEAIAVVSSQFLTLILGTTFLYLKFPLIYLILAFTIPSFLNVCYASTVLFVQYRIRLKPSLDKEVLKFFGAIAVPFALAAIFSRVYSYIDSILLSKLAGDEVVGWYSIPYKIAYAFQFIPLALVAALYPRFSEYFVHNRERLRYVFEQGIKYLLLVSFPLVVGISILSHDIVVSIFTTEYLNSILPLQILMAGIIFSFLNFHIGALFNACNRQITQTTLLGTVMIVNIILNIILIPRLGAVGAAVSALSGNIILTVLSSFIIPKITKISLVFLGKTIVQLAIAATVMGVAVWYTNLYTSFVMAILVGALVYLAMLFITRGINIRQIKEVIYLVRR